MTAAEEWDILATRVMDLATRGVRLGLRMGESTQHGEKGFGESVLFHEQHSKGMKLLEDLRAFMLAQVKEAQAPPTKAAPATTPAKGK